jgi:hypothetical protein
MAKLSRSQLKTLVTLARDGMYFLPHAAYGCRPLITNGMGFLQYVHSATGAALQRRGYVTPDASRAPREYITDAGRAALESEGVHVQPFALAG